MKTCFCSSVLRYCELSLPRGPIEGTGHHHELNMLNALHANPGRFLGCNSLVSAGPAPASLPTHSPGSRRVTDGTTHGSSC